MYVSYCARALVIWLCACWLVACDKSGPTKEEVIQGEMEALRTSMQSIQPEGQAKPQPGSCEAYFLGVMEGALKHLQMGSSLEKPYLLGALMVLPAEPGAGDSGHLFLHFLEYESWTMGVLAWRADGPPPHGWLLPLFAHDRWGRRFEELRKYTVFCSVTVDVLVIDAQETGVTVRFWPTDQASCKPTLLLPAQFVRGNLKLRLYDQKSQFSNTVKPTWITEDEAGMTYEEIGDLSRLAR